MNCTPWWCRCSAICNSLGFSVASAIFEQSLGVAGVSFHFDQALSRRETQHPAQQRQVYAVFVVVRKGRLLVGPTDRWETFVVYHVYIIASRIGASSEMPP